jgi:hypothetical protein
MFTSFSITTGKPRHVERVQPLDVRRQLDPPSVRTEDARASDGAVPHGARIDAGAPGDVQHHVPDLDDDVPCAAAVRILRRIADDPAGQVRQGDLDLRAAEVDAENEGAVRPQRVSRGAAADGSLRSPEQSDESCAFQLADDLRRGLLRQSGQPG